jgi:hypothetical protein
MVRTGQLGMDGARSELATEKDTALRLVALGAFSTAIKGAAEPVGVSV